MYYRIITTEVREASIDLGIAFDCCLKAALWVLLNLQPRL